MADYGNNVIKPGTEKPTGFDLNNTSGGQMATRKPSPFQAVAQALAPLVPARRQALLSQSRDPFKIDPSLISANRKKNPFLIQLVPSPTANGTNIPA
jgi:hypothetical protein